MNADVERGRRMLAAIEVFYGLPPGGSVPIEISGDLAGDALVLHPDYVVANGPDGVRIAQALAEPPRPHPVTPEGAPNTLGEAARVLARAGVSEATMVLCARIAFRTADGERRDRCVLCGAVTGPDHRHAHELAGYPTHGHDLDGYDCIPVRVIEGNTAERAERRTR